MGINSGAFKDAPLFRDASATFRFCDSPAYEDVDVADFFNCSLRNRSRSDVALRRAVSFIFSFRSFATDMDPQLPFMGPSP